MATTDFKMEGGAELVKALQELPVKIERNVMRGTMRAAAKPMAKRAKALAPVDTGALKQSVRVSTKARRGRVTATITAGNGKDVYYAHMVEFGTAAHLIKPKTKKSLGFKGGEFAYANHPGITPRPFMRTAMDTEAGASVQAAIAYAKKRLPKEVQKIASRTGRK